MDLVEVDHVDAEPLRALAAVALDPAGGRRDREDLGRDERFLAAIAERLADDALGVAAAVDLGGVDHVHAEVERALEDATGLDVGVLGAVAPVLRAELPRAEPDGREPVSVHLDEAHAARSLRVSQAQMPRGPRPVDRRPHGDGGPEVVAASAASEPVSGRMSLVALPVARLTW